MAAIDTSLNKRVVHWLCENSRYPKVAVRLWADILELVPNGGRIPRTREQLAEMVGISPRELSRLMGELSDGVQVIRRERVREPGRKGPWAVHYIADFDLDGSDWHVDEYVPQPKAAIQTDEAA